MKWIENAIICFLIIGVLITEYHTYLFHKWSFTEKLIASKWMDENHNEKIPFLYFMYEIEPLLKEIIWTTLFSIVAGYKFKRVRNVLIVFIFYYCTQLWFYLYNRNTSLFANFIVYLYMFLAILASLIQTKKKAKVIYIEEY